MPFTPYRSTFAPDDLKIVNQAFEMAWHEVSDTPGAMIDPKKARNIIARRIVDAWTKHGERDPEMLKAYALRVFRRPE